MRMRMRRPGAAAVLLRAAAGRCTRPTRRRLLRPGEPRPGGGRETGSSNNAEREMGGREIRAANFSNFEKKILGGPGPKIASNAPAARPCRRGSRGGGLCPRARGPPPGRCQRPERGLADDGQTSRPSDFHRGARRPASRRPGGPGPRGLCSARAGRRGCRVRRGGPPRPQQGPLPLALARAPRRARRRPRREREAPAPPHRIRAHPAAADGAPAERRLRGGRRRPSVPLLLLEPAEPVQLVRHTTGLGQDDDDAARPASVVVCCRPCSLLPPHALQPRRHAQEHEQAALRQEAGDPLVPRRVGVGADPDGPSRGPAGGAGGGGGGPARPG
jgi:hypothetical protein